MKPSLYLLVSISLLHGPFLPAATLTIHTDAASETPVNLSYNLAHFYPGSNTADWWRYSRVSGARIFMAASHFNVSAANRPGDATVTNEASFLARRSALRADPLNTDYINWPTIEQRFNTTISGNNKIIPQYALEQIHQRGGKVMAQMTVSEGSFPIDDESDWGGKWILWRTYYAAAFHMARYFDVERYTSHNEPNHPDSLISPESWLMRVRLASDAAQSALEDVNALYGKSLQPRFTVPITAGSGESSYLDYGQPAVTGIQTNFLGQTGSSYRLFQTYGYQQYNQTPSGFESYFLNLRGWVDGDTPAGVDALPFAITEYNVHTGATYDTLVENADTLSKAVRLGAITSRLVQAGMDELYCFKFGMTVSSGNFPVQKNGMLYTDNTYSPYNYGTMSRSAEAFRLFNKGFAPGRLLQQHTLAGDGATSLELQVSYDPESGFYYIYSANESGSSIPLEIDVSALGIPNGNQLIIEDVSQWRRGIIRSIEQIQEGWILPGSQPGQTAWLISIPALPQRQAGSDSSLQGLSVSKDAMVRDGIHASTTHGTNPSAWTRNDPASANNRAAAFLQFDLPEDWDPADLQLAILALPVASASGSTDTIHAHLYGIDNHDWDESSLTWNNAPNLKKNAPVGNRIRHGVIDGAGESAHVLAQLTAGSGFTTRHVDVTDYLVRQSAKASFLLNQDPRWDADINVSEIPASWNDLVQGDTQPDGIQLRTREAAGDPSAAATLILVRRIPPPVDYATWIAAAFPGVTDPATIGEDANPAHDGLPNLLKFALGLDPTTAAGFEAPGLVVEDSTAAAYYFSINQLATGVGLILESSNDLQLWTDVEDVVTLMNDGIQASVKAPLAWPPVGSPIFLRLRAEPQGYATLTYTEDFDLLASSGSDIPWTDDATLPGWFADKAVYSASSGGANSGTMASFGTSSADTDRALGGVPTLATSISIAMRLVNDTGATVDKVDISNVVEQWRQDAAPDSQVVLAYQVFEPETGSIAASGYSTLLSTTPSVAGPSSSIDGNVNQTPQAVSLNELGLENGQELWLRWTFSKNGGQNINLGIDDVEVVLHVPQ